MLEVRMTTFVDFAETTAKTSTPQPARYVALGSSAPAC